MKNYFLGILTLFLINFTLEFMMFKGLSIDNDFIFKVGYHGGDAVRGIYLVKPLTDRCDVNQRICKEKSCITKAEYFNCDVIQIKLNEIIYGKKS